MTIKFGGLVGFFSARACIYTSIRFWFGFSLGTSLSVVVSALEF
jgi:hypothetical protein